MSSGVLPYFAGEALKWFVAVTGLGFSVPNCLQLSANTSVNRVIGFELENIAIIFGKSPLVYMRNHSTPWEIHSSSELVRDIRGVFPLLLNPYCFG